MFVDADVSLSDLERCNLEMSVWHRAKCESSRFSGAKLDYADFSWANVMGADFSGANLFRARFHRVMDRGAIFTSRLTALGDDEELAKAEDFKPVH